MLLIYFRISEGAGVNFIASSIGKIVYVRERERIYLCMCMYICVFTESLLCGPCHMHQIYSKEPGKATALMKCVCPYGRQKTKIIPDKRYENPGYSVKVIIEKRCEGSSYFR